MDHFMPRSNWRRAVKARWFVTLSLFYFFQLASGFAGTYLPRYLGWLGLSGTAIGLAFGVQAVARSLAMPLWSYASDRYGISVRLVRLQFVFALPYFALPWVSDERAVVALLVLAGLTVQCAIPVTDVVTMRELSTSAFGRVRALGSLGFGGAAAVFAWMGLRHTHLELAQVSVWVIVGLMLFSATAALGFPASTASLTRPTRSDFVNMVKNPWLLALLPIWCVHWGSQIPYNMYLVYFAEARGFGAWMPGLSVMVAIVAEVAFLAFGTPLVERMGPVRSLVAVVAATAVRWFLMAWLTDPIAVVVLQLLHGLTFGGFMLSMMSVLNREIPGGLRATAQAVLYVVVFGLGGALAQGASGYWMDHHDAISLFEAAGWLEVLLLVPVLVLTVFYRRAGRHRVSALS